MKGRPFTLEEERYLITQLSHSDDRTAVKALQWMSERCREGYWFADASKIRSSVRLCLHRALPNAKRWAVNALVEIGVGGDLSPILALLHLCDEDPDLLAAIVAAIFSSKSEEEAVSLLADNEIPMSGLALVAASQHSLPQKAELVRTTIPLETSDAPTLRSAIVLAGTNKAPEHLFDERHPNAIALSQLNNHDISSVSKYSIWALSQLRLGFSSLLLPQGDIESSKPEVRKWAYRLLISDPPAMARNLDMLSSIQKDSNSEVREEAAIELRDVFVPGLEHFISEWFFREEYCEARLLLLDHMAAQSEAVKNYEQIVVEFYRRASPKSDERIRLEAAAAKTPLYATLRKIDIGQERGSLFAMNDNTNEEGNGSTFHITRNIQAQQIGAVSGGGGISAETIAAVATADPAVKDQLEQVLAIVRLVTDPKILSEGEELVKETAREANPSKWKKIIGFLNAIKDGTVAVSGTVTGIDGVIEGVQALGG